MSPTGELRSVTFRCRGHPDIRASHRKSVEFTRDPSITTRATCVLGVGADVDPSDLAGFRGPVAVTITAGTRTDVLHAVANPRFEPGGTAVIRVSRHASPETLAVAADKGADRLDRELVAELARPESTVVVTVTEEPASGRPGPGEFVAVWLPELHPVYLTPQIREAVVSASVVSGERPTALRRLFADAGLDVPVRELASAGDERGDETVRAQLRAGERVAYVAVSGGPDAEPGRAGGPLARTAGAAAEAGAAARIVPPPPLELAALVAAGPGTAACILTGTSTSGRRGRARMLDSAAATGTGLAWRESSSSLDGALEETAAALGRCSVRVWVEPASPQALLLAGTPADVALQWDSLGRPPGDVIVFVCVATGSADGLLAALLDQGVSARTLARALATLPGREYRGEYRRVLRLKSDRAQS